MFGISFLELVTISLIAVFFLKPQEIKTIVIKFKKIRFFLKQDLRIFDVFNDTDIIYDQKISLDENKKKKQKPRQ